MSFQQIKEARNILTFTGALQFLISDNTVLKDRAQKIIDLFENDMIGFEFVEDGELLFESSKLCVIFPINWYEKGGDSWGDIMKTVSDIEQWFNVRLDKNHVCS
jgi:hypothetical protein